MSIAYADAREKVRRAMVEKRAAMGKTMEQIARESRVSVGLIRLLEEGEITHPGIAARVASAYGLGKKAARLLVHPKHWGGAAETDVQPEARQTFSLKKQGPEAPSAPKTRTRHYDHAPGSPRGKTPPPKREPSPKDVRYCIEGEDLIRLAKEMGMNVRGLSLAAGWHKTQLARRIRNGYLYEADVQRLEQVTGRGRESFTRQVTHRKCGYGRSAGGTLAIDPEKIRARCREAGIAKAEASRRIGRNGNYVSRSIERGLMPMEDLHDLAEVLGCRTEDLTP